MKEIKNPIFSLNVLGPMGDDTQEFEIGASSIDTVAVKVGTVVLRDDGAGALFINGEGTYTSEDVDKIADDILKASKDYTDEMVSTIGGFDIVIVEELPQEGEKGIIYLVPKENTTGYKEYIYITDTWEEVGDTDLDLNDYYTSAQIDQLFLPKTGGTITGALEIQGDITVKKIKLGNATITLYVDTSTDETTVTIEGGTIYLTGNVQVDGDIYQQNGNIIQYVDSSNV